MDDETAIYLLFYVDKCAHDGYKDFLGSWAGPPSYKQVHEVLGRTELGTGFYWRARKEITKEGYKELRETGKVKDDEADEYPVLFLLEKHMSPLGYGESYDT